MDLLYKIVVIVTIPVWLPVILSLAVLTLGWILLSAMVGMLLESMRNA